MLNNKAIVFYYLEWIVSHPRFGLLMIGLICLSFLQNPTIAVVLFCVFVIEISARIILFFRQQSLNPYANPLHRNIDIFFFVLDFIGILSLLITIYALPMDGEHLTLLRLIRAGYLLRTLRFVRYIDLHAAMFSPAYGMFISIVIVISFFATDMLLLVITIYLFTELGLRLIIMKSMVFESKKEKNSEWAIWWLDLLATFFMLPFFELTTYSSAIRMLRLVRLFRPWKTIFDNLREVLRQGQFGQEINLMVLILAVLSMTIGGFFFFFIEPQHYMPVELIAAGDSRIVSAIWHAFRLLTDPGNSSEIPGSTIVIIVSVIGVILGVFVFAFFIGIGSSIVSGLMKRLRNERLIANNHIVMIGWSPTAPYIVKHLGLIADRTYDQVKVILLNHDENIPKDIVENKWVTYRQGHASNPADLRRVHLSAASLALYMSPAGQPEALSVSGTFHSMMSIRRENPDIRLCVAFPGMKHPRLASHQHMLQVGWDKEGKYNKPTAVISETEFRTTTLCNILRYSDFDHVFQRLMIPELSDDSGMLLVEWDADLRLHQGEWMISTPDGTDEASTNQISSFLFQRGVILIGVILDDTTMMPIYKLDELEGSSARISMLLGISVNEGVFRSAMLYAIHEKDSLPASDTILEEPDDIGLKLQEPEDKMRLLIAGSVGSLPLLLKQLLRFYQELELIILDNLSPEEIISEEEYIKRRVAEEPGLDELMTITVKAWNFVDMEYLRQYVVEANHIILCPPRNLDETTFSLASTVLSSIVSIAEDEQITPQIFPVMENITQAGLLQNELGGIDLSVDIHVTVLNELYGAYVSHTTYNMHSAKNPEDYKIKQALRKSLKKFMTDTGESSEMGLKIFAIHQPLPSDATELFQLLYEAGYIWIGYTMRHAYHWKDPISASIQAVFPRNQKHVSERQNHIIINPFGSPISSHSWLDCKDDIVELITIGGDNDVELF
ncbi:MAG: hypothetical protein R8K22_07270 [Mariprofundaceae bacterium]